MDRGYCYLYKKIGMLNGYLYIYISIATLVILYIRFSFWGQLKSHKPIYSINSHDIIPFLLRTIYFISS